ncbi:MAG: ATPase domain-containing protein [Candidatus Sifarchaeia archaeon]|jgi:KaiC/GvpD/RAD55 family RecA-like ATPase
MNSIERVKTGIPELDDLLNGGLIKNSSTVITGGVGTGKTILSLQFLWTGAKTYKEPGLLITIDESPAELRREAAMFGWDLKELEEENLLGIIDVATPRAGLPSDERYTLRELDLRLIVEKIYDTHKEIKAQRAVIDSLSALGFRYDSLGKIRSTIFQLTAFLNELEVTSLMTVESPENSSMSRFGIEEFLAQGVIQLFLRNDDAGNLTRNLQIRKMRSTQHSLKNYFFEISDKGIVILSG